MTPTLARMARGIAPGLRRRVLLLVIVGAGVLIATSPRVHLARSVDACLDRGGSFDHARATCDFETSHPVRGGVTAPWISSGGLAAAAALVLAAATVQVLSRSRRSSG